MAKYDPPPEMDQFADWFAQIMRQCKQNGMVLPFIICAARPNGSVLAIRADGRGHSDILAKHFEPKGVQLPMTIMVLDQQNNTVRVTIDPTGKARSDVPSADPQVT
jgi:uncharacterized protein (DUF302 family)